MKGVSRDGGGFIAGAVSGYVGSTYSVAIQNTGNHIFFDDPLMTPREQFISIGIGTLAGGLINGSVAAANGRSFWSGRFDKPAAVPMQSIYKNISDVKIKDLQLTKQIDVGIEGRNTFFEGSKYSDKVIRQMAKVDDLAHHFPKSVDGFATKYGQWSIKFGGDGHIYYWLKMPGSWGDKTGIFEYTNDVNGIINHRYFNFK